MEKTVGLVVVEERMGGDYCGGIGGRFGGANRWDGIVEVGRGMDMGNFFFFFYFFFLNHLLYRSPVIIVFFGKNPSSNYS